jgi:hypothetical protein
MMMAMQTLLPACGSEAILLAALDYTAEAMAGHFTKEGLGKPRPAWSFVAGR